MAAAEARAKAIALEQALQELRLTQTKLVQQEKMSSLGQLVAGVAHEINNPVNFIYGNLAHTEDYSRDLLRLVALYRDFYPDLEQPIADLIEEIDLDFLMIDLPKMLDSMKLGAERIKEIVQSLRIFSRMDEAEMKVVNIHEGLDSTLTILNGRMKPKNNRLGIEVIRDYGTLPEIECYAGQLNQVFMNILVNAIDTLEERDQQRSMAEMQANPSRIRIMTERRGEQAVIRIQDNGLGIPQEVQQRLFDPFYTTKPVGKGTGLGLSISYQIVTEKHGGTLICESAPGEGSTFEITIPLWQPNAPS
jgi:signal transduction histidine kinase